MDINKDLIKHIASLSKLNLTDKEIERFKDEFKEILQAFSKIKEVDTDKIKPSFQPIEIKPTLREDKPEECLTNKMALSLTEHKKDNYFKGPRVL